MVVNELRGEKVDIVPYSDDPSEFVMKALAPARVREVRIHPDTGTAEVIVPDFQLSLAIGKEGQNARLAARLTGWRVDIKSETQLAEEESGGGVEYAEGEWVTNDSGELVWQPAEGGEAISAAEAGYAAPDGRRRAAADARRGAPSGRAPAAPATRRRPRTPSRRSAGRGGAEVPAEAAPRRGGAERRRRRRRRATAYGPRRTCVGCRRVAAGRRSWSGCAATPRSGSSSGRARDGAPGSARTHPGACLDRARERRRRSARALRIAGAGTATSSGYARDWSTATRRAATRATSA